MLLLGEQDFAASGHDSFDANSLVMVTLRQSTRGRIRGNILEAESFDYIDHEVGTRAVQSQNIDFG